MVLTYVYNKSSQPHLTGHDIRSFQSYLRVEDRQQPVVLLQLLVEGSTEALQRGK